LKTTWTRIYPTGDTPNYSTQMACYTMDTDQRKFYMFGGQGSYYRSNLFCYTPATNILTDVIPDTRYDPAMIYVQSRDSIYLAFGTNYNGHPYNDLWKYNCAAASWSRLSTSNVPLTTTRKRGMSMVYSSVLDALLLFSGEGTNTNDIWKYDFTNNNWYQLYPTGSLPLYRYEYGSAFDTKNERWYIFGGTGSATYNDLWYYDVKSNSWVKVAALGNIPSIRRGSGMCYDSTQECIWLFGGYDGSYYNTLYKYVIASNTWVQIQYTGYAVSARNGTNVEYDYRTQSLYLFGGFNGSVYLNDLFRYDIISNTLFILNVDSFIPVAKSYSGSSFNTITGDFYIFGGYISTAPYVVSEFSKYNIWDMVTPSGIVSATTSGVQLNTRHWSNLLSISPNTVTAGDSAVYHALSFDNRNSFVVTSGTGWNTVVRNNLGNWQYLDNSGTWQNSSKNDPAYALSLAIMASGNQMSSSSLSTISPSSYALSGGFSEGTKTLDFGLGFYSPSNYLSQLQSYSVAYSAPARNIELISEQWQASAVNPVSAFCLLDIRPLDSILLDVDLTVWVSSDNGSTYDQISGLSVIHYTDDSHWIVKGFNTNLTQYSDNRMRLKILTHNDKRIEVHSMGVALRYQ
jgi:hypothetical protein